MYATGTADIGLTENVGSGGTKFELWFRKRSREVWTVSALIPQVKNKWVKTIEKLLWDQAIRNRETKQAELVSMGIGNKPSLDLAESSDNINDRCFNINIPPNKATPKKFTHKSGGSENASPSSYSSYPSSSICSSNGSSSTTSSLTNSTPPTHDNVISCERPISWTDNSSNGSFCSKSLNGATPDTPSNLDSNRKVSDSMLTTAITRRVSPQSRVLLDTPTTESEI